MGVHQHAPVTMKQQSQIIDESSASSFWVHRRFLQDTRLRVAERYRRRPSRDTKHHVEGRLPSHLFRATTVDCVDNSSNNNQVNSNDKPRQTLIVPQAIVIRKYLPLVVRLINDASQRSGSCFAWILLESCIDYLDWRNQVGAERAAAFERQRLQATLEHTSYLLDASLILLLGNEEETDEWDALEYSTMTETERCRQSLVRAVHWLLKVDSTVDIMVLVDKEELPNAYDLEQTRAKYVTMDELLETIYNSSSTAALSTDDRAAVSSSWMDLKYICEQDYQKRNAPKRKKQDENHDVTLLLQDELSETEIQEGLKSGTLLRGRFNVSKDNVTEAYVTVASQRTYFIDKMYFHQAIHQDMVILQVLPESQWGRPVGRRRLVHHRDNNNNDDNDGDDDNNHSSNDASDPDVAPVPSARIVGIHSVGRRVFAATLLDTPHPDENVVMVVPMDIRIPKIRIRTKTWKHRFPGNRIKVEITGWESESKYPQGQCLSILGPIGDLETEIKALLIENQVELEPFTVPALSCLPVEGSDWRVKPEDLAGRRDLRTSRRIFSVDPPGTQVSSVHTVSFLTPFLSLETTGCQDIDDSMHAQVLPNGDVEIGVHIADVTHFVPHKSPLDLEAQARGTTFYLVDRRFDMLPSLLSSDLCSLHGGIDRLAVSAIWVLSKDFKVVKSVWFGRTVIHNCAAMTYDQADRILQGISPEPLDLKRPPALTAGAPVDPTLIPALKKDLTILTNLARFMRQNREDFGGAVDLTSNESGSELKFVLENGIPQKVAPKEDKEIHHTIAELMIMANTDVAKQIYKAFPTTALLRVHRSVEESRIEELKEVLGAAGISLHGTDGKSLAEALRKAKDKSNNTPYQSLLLSVATRAMTEAQYISTGDEKAGADLRHYGLGLDFYTHFTSPIRRYADVIVHKQLLASLTQQSGIASASSKLVVVDPLQSIPKSNVMSVLNGASGEFNPADDVDIDGLIDAMTEGASSLIIDDPIGLQGEMEKAAVILYSPSEVSGICEGLNLHNRLAKQSSFECQALFLSLYFKNHEEIVSAVVTTIRDNGFYAYVPKFDIRGPVYVRDIGGVVQLDPKLLGLAKDAGAPPAVGFRAPTRSLPGATTHLVEADRLEIHYDGRIAHSIKPMNVVTVRLTCDDWDVRARVPQPRLHLVHGKEPKAKTRVLQIDSSILTASNQEADRNVPSKNASVDEYSLFDVLSELTIRPDIPISNSKKELRNYVCHQTIRGRYIFSGFVNPDTKSATQEAAQMAAQQAAAAAVADKRSSSKTPSYDVARSMEKSATLRQQRLMAAKRNAQRSSKGKKQS